MDHAGVLRLFDRRVRRDAPPDHAGVRVEDRGNVVRWTGGPHDWNGVVWSDLDAANADAAIAEQVRHYGALGVGFEWKTHSHDTPADLGERLLCAGFTAREPESLMVAEVAAPTAPAGGGERPDGLRLVDVTDAVGIDLAVGVHEAAFGTDGGRLRDQLLERLAHAPDSFVVTLAMAGDRPVGSARIEFTPGTDFAGLWGGGIVTGFRGRGLYRDMVAHRARLAADRGARFLVVDAMPTSAPILRRLGFERLGTTTPYFREP
ncbi:GNAT family N-acetyltransferase [Streptomyces alkaliphilus]|uniref:GNAT family N-acetyltransferase n=1 Tax=Streptomyces alkaliphilus TaxID=1472722 RepID=UPI001180788C|nr:GNAT family N-acetyltransferase [Streptomyces alkaliphilus]MQS07589.1 GNAT family N-acetyltransferase [Streptomyces alkaliphilus]